MKQQLMELKWSIKGPILGNGLGTIRKWEGMDEYKWEADEVRESWIPAW